METAKTACLLAYTTLVQMHAQWGEKNNSAFTFSPRVFRLLLPIPVLVGVI